MNLIKVRSNQREEMIEITAEAEKLLPLDGDGICFLFSRHTTCGLTINENADPDVKRDMLLFLKKLIPQYDPDFRHFEHNSDAHIKSSLVGSSLSIPFEKGRLMLGRWQGIYLCEFDGPKDRQVAMKILSNYGPQADSANQGPSGGGFGMPGII
jgi:secondary thiamine-phosphate synthase enzyme